MSLVQMNMDIVREFAKKVKALPEVSGSTLSLDIANLEHTLYFGFDVQWVTKETHAEIQQMTEDNSVIKMLIEANALSIRYGKLN